MVLTSESQTEAEPMSRRVYRNPPVHEVVLDLQFADAAEPDAVREFPETTSRAFGEAKPITRISTHALASPRGVANRPPEHSFWGWEFVDESTRRISTVSANQLTQHFLRSDAWPQGTYVGWEANAASFLELLDAAQELFEGLGIRRAGLRYVNRIAVPQDSMLADWFRVVPPPLEELDQLWEFSISRTWERAKDFPGLSGTVTIKMSEDEPPSASEGQQDIGVVLDIDIFNLWVRDAPNFSEVPSWIERAHALENRVFESCITDPLAARFGIMEES